MKVYVDELRSYGKKGVWCHMWSPSVEDLHAMASMIGIKREWFQGHPDHPHYDLRKSMRDRAIASGAVECKTIEIIQMLRGLREIE
jgi:hypothetical protein